MTLLDSLIFVQDWIRDMRKTITKDNPLHVVVTQHAEPYVALVLYAAQTFEQKDPQFAKQLEEAARYFEGLMLKKRRRR